MNKILRTALIYSLALLLLCSAPLLSSHSIGVLGVDAIDTQQLRWLFWQPRASVLAHGLPHSRAGPKLAGSPQRRAVARAACAAGRQHLDAADAAAQWPGRSPPGKPRQQSPMERRCRGVDAAQLRGHVARSQPAARPPADALWSINAAGRAERREPRARQVGIWLGISALCYWFWAPMLLLATVPLLFDTAGNGCWWQPAGPLH